jgi:hypothetical protein
VVRFATVRISLRLATLIKSFLKSLFRPYLHMYSDSRELEEIGVISLNGINLETNQQSQMLFGVSDGSGSNVTLLNDSFRH